MKLITFEHIDRAKNGSLTVDDVIYVKRGINRNEN